MNRHDNNQKIGLCGFRNIGNTCYMNSTLQLVIHSKVMINFLIAKSNPFVGNSLKFIELFKKRLIDAEFVDYLENGVTARLQEKERKKLKLDSDEPVEIQPYLIEREIENSFTIKLAEIINLIIYKGISEFTPTEFKQVVNLKIPQLNGYSQQDSHELLNLMLDGIIEETGVEANATINNVPSNLQNYIELLEKIKIQIQNGKTPKRQLIEQLNNFRKSNRFIVNRYEGLNYTTQIFKNYYNPMIQKLLTITISIVICKNESCQCEKTTYSHTPMLVLNMKSSARSELTDHFDTLIEDEEIDYKCSECSCLRAIKTTRIWQPSMVLFIEICRFGNTNGNTFKNSSYVDIPETLNLSKYCDKSNNLNNDNLNYKLKGITNHMGGLNGGHYTADCVSIMDNSTWYNFDDSNVYRYNGSNINKSNAYMLLYELEF